MNEDRLQRNFRDSSFSGSCLRSKELGREFRAAKKRISAGTTLACVTEGLSSDSSEERRSFTDQISGAKTARSVNVRERGSLGKQKEKRLYSGLVFRESENVAQLQTVCVCPGPTKDAFLNIVNFLGPWCVSVRLFKRGHSLGNIEVFSTVPARIRALVSQADGNECHL